MKHIRKFVKKIDSYYSHRWIYNELHSKYYIKTKITIQVDQNEF